MSGVKHIDNIFHFYFLLNGPCDSDIKNHIWRDYIQIQTILTRNVIEAVVVVTLRAARTDAVRDQRPKTKDQTHLYSVVPTSPSNLQSGWGSCVSLFQRMLRLQFANLSTMLASTIHSQRNDVSKLYLNA